MKFNKIDDVLQKVRDGLAGVLTQILNLDKVRYKRNCTVCPIIITFYANYLYVYHTWKKVVILGCRRYRAKNDAKWQKFANSKTIFWLTLFFNFFHV